MGGGGTNNKGLVFKIKAHDKAAKGQIVVGASLSTGKPLVIFVNGYWNKDMPYAGEDILDRYWGISLRTSILKYFNSEREFFINGAGTMCSSGKTRFKEGVDFVKARLNNPSSKFNKSVFASNSIIIVSHSMGAAFAEGIISELVKQHICVNSIVHLSPADNSDFQVHLPDITYQIDIVPDPVLAYKNFDDSEFIRGIKHAGVVSNPYKDMYGHMYTKESSMVVNWLSDLRDISFQFLKHRIKLVKFNPITISIPILVRSKVFIAKEVTYNTKFSKIKKNGIVYYHYRDNMYEK